ncbi:MAG: hypothetical protein RLZZ93_280 [Actinomycetota bacterium]
MTQQDEAGAPQPTRSTRGGHGTGERELPVPAGRGNQRPKVPVVLEDLTQSPVRDCGPGSLSWLPYQTRSGTPSPSPTTGPIRRFKLSRATNKVLCAQSHPTSSRTYAWRTDTIGTRCGCGYAECVTNRRDVKWPEGFMWGTGASSTQCEGASPDSDWYQWERAGHAPISGDGNNFAIEYAHDFERLSSMGVPASLHTASVGRQLGWVPRPRDSSEVLVKTCGFHR